MYVRRMTISSPRICDTDAVAGFTSNPLTSEK
jgi:hypothetical protein